MKGVHGIQLAHLHVLRPGRMKGVYPLMRTLGLKVECTARIPWAFFKMKTVMAIASNRWGLL